MALQTTAQAMSAALPPINPKPSPTQPISPLPSIGVAKPTASPADFAKAVDAATPSTTQIQAATAQGVNPVTGKSIAPGAAVAPKAVAPAQDAPVGVAPITPISSPDTSKYLNTVAPTAAKTSGPAASDQSFTTWQIQNPTKSYADWQNAKKAPTAPSATPTAPSVPSATPSTPNTNSTTHTDSVNGVIGTINAGVYDYNSKLDALTSQGTAAEVDQRDAITQAAIINNQQNQKYNDDLQAIQQQVLESRNAALQLGSDVERRDAELAYQTATNELDLQRQRSQKAYQDQVVEQELSNKSALLSKESAIAAFGGFGSLNMFKEKQATILSNDRMIQNVKFEANMADQSITNKKVEESTKYENKLKEIETNKQIAITKSYQDFLTYSASITNDKEKSENEKAQAIKQAQVQYTQNVSQINSKSFDAKHAESVRAAGQIQSLSLKQVNVQLSQQYGYAVDANGKEVFDEMGKRVPIEKTLTNKNIDLAKDYLGNATGYFDYTTKQYVKFDSPQTFGKSALDKFSTAGDKDNPSYNQCGHFANSVTTCAHVGDTLADKMSKTDPTIAIPKTGMSLILPLGLSGHDAVVLGYNASTGDISVVERNRQGAAQGGEPVTTYGTYNMNTLKQKYGSTFGFIPGELRPEYAGLAQESSTQGGSTSDMILKGYKTKLQQQNYMQIVSEGKIPPDLAKTAGGNTPSGEGGATGLSDYNQYGLLSKTDFDPNNETDKKSSLYLDYYLKNAAFPTSYQLGMGKTGGSQIFSDAAERANNLYYAATGSSLPDVTILKSNKALISGNNKLLNNLSIQEGTVTKNFKLAIDNLEKGGINQNSQPINAFLNNIKDMWGDPDVAQYLTQNGTLQNEVGNLISIKNASGTTVADKLASAGLIPQNASEDQQKSILKILLQEAENGGIAVKDMNSALYSQVDPLERLTENPNRKSKLSSDNKSSVKPETGKTSGGFQYEITY